MNQYLKVAGIFLLLAVIFSCNDNEDKDLTNSVNKNGAVETSVSTSHLNDSLDILTTKHEVWKNNVAIKSVEYHDTVPALGKEKREVTDKDGNTVKTDVQKDYEIFITVK
jgi:hypothetical protein